MGGSVLLKERSNSANLAAWPDMTRALHCSRSRAKKVIQHETPPFHLSVAASFAPFLLRSCLCSMFPQCLCNVQHHQHLTESSDDESEDSDGGEGEEETSEEHCCSILTASGRQNVLQHVYAGLAVVLGVGDMTERLKYNIIHHTFWSNLVLAFFLGFWIALIGLPNYCLTARLFLYGETAQTAEIQASRGIDWDLRGRVTEIPGCPSLLRTLPRFGSHM